MNATNPLWAIALAAALAVGLASTPAAAEETPAACEPIFIDNGTPRIDWSCVPPGPPVVNEVGATLQNL